MSLTASTLFRFLTVFFGVLHAFIGNWASNFRFMDDFSLQNFFYRISMISFMSCFTFAALAIYIDRKTFFATKGRLAVSLVIFLAILYCAFITKAPAFIIPFVVGLAVCAGTDKSIFRSILVSALPLFVITVTLGLLGVMVGGDMEDTGLFSNKENVTQLFALGFSNPNQTYMYFLAVLLPVLFLYGRKKIVGFAGLAMAVVLGVLTGCTAGTVIAVPICLVFLLPRQTRMVAGVKRIAPWGFLLITIMSFALVSVSYSDSNLNDALTGRPFLWSKRIENGSYLNFFGNNDEYTTEKVNKETGLPQTHYALDNTPIYLMVYCGIPIFLLFVFIYYRAGKIIQDERLLTVGMLLLLLLMFERTSLVANLYMVFAIKYTASYYLNNQKKVLAYV